MIKLDTDRLDLIELIEHGRKFNCLNKHDPDISEETVFLVMFQLYGMPVRRIQQ